MRNKSILIVEDDLEIKTLIQFFLEKDEELRGEYEILTSQDGLKALKIIQENKPKLIVLDLMLPGLDGIGVSKQIKSNTDLYGNPLIFMLTAKSEIDDIVEGFHAGCDDYLKKPFDPRELVLRIKKLLSLRNDSKKLINENTLEYKDVVVHIDKHVVLYSGVEIELSSKEFNLLVFLITNKGLALSREKILNNVWNENYFLGDRTVDVYIGKLRDKIPNLSNYIKTIKGVGYQLKNN